MKEDIKDNLLTITMNSFAGSIRQVGIVLMVGIILT